MPPVAGASSLVAVAAVLAKVRAAVPAKFLKMSGNIHLHKKVLHNALLNNLRMHDMLGGDISDDGVGADGQVQPPARDRAQIATRAVQLLQRTEAIAGLTRAFADRASLRSDSGSIGAVSRLCNPLAAYFGAPGGK